MGRPWAAYSLPVRLGLLVALAVAEAARPVPKLAKPDYSIYHTKDQVFDLVHKVVASCPTTMRFDEVTHVNGNYSATLSVVTVEPAGLSDDHTDKLRLLLNFGEHGRELISPEIALRLLHLLCHAEQRALLLDAYGVQRSALDAVLERTVFKIIPMENVKGRERVEAGDLCERKNGRGVDPNRNWDVHWGFKEKDYDAREEYPGPNPFSEPEAALILELAQSVRPHVWASIHSGMEALFMPYDHKPHIPDGEGPAATLSILKKLNERTCQNRCAVGSGGKSVGYLAHGTATDYMYDRLGIPVSMTWEVYGDEKAVFEDCFRLFNPLTKEVYNRTVESWTAAIFTLLTLLPQHPQIQQELALPGGSGGGLGSTGTEQVEVAADGVVQPSSVGSASAAGEGGMAAGAGGDALGGRGGGGMGSGSGGSMTSGTAARETAGLEASDGGGIGAAGSSTSGAGADADADTATNGSSSDAVSNSIGGAATIAADKAAEIAAELKEHLKQQEQAAAAAAAVADGSKLRVGGSGGGTQPAAYARRSGTFEALYWLTVGITGCGLASYVWSKPRVRYQLSKWAGKLGSSRRRHRSLL